MEGVSLMLHNLENKLMESSMELSDFLKSKSTIIHRFITEISSLQFDADYTCIQENALAAVTDFLGETKHNWLISNREISLVKKDLAGNVTNVEVIDITENLVYTLTFKTTELFSSVKNQYCIDTIYVGKVDDTKSKEAFTHFNLLLAHYVASNIGRNQSAIISLETNYTFNLSFAENLASLSNGFFKHSLLPSAKFSLDYIGKPYYRFSKTDIPTKTSINYIFSQPSPVHKQYMENLHHSLQNFPAMHHLKDFQNAYNENSIPLQLLITTLEYFTILNPFYDADEHPKVTYSSYGNDYQFKFPSKSNIPTFAVDKKILYYPYSFAKLKENTLLLDCLEVKLYNIHTIDEILGEDEKLDYLLQPFTYLLDSVKELFDID